MSESLYREIEPKMIIKGMKNLGISPEKSSRIYGEL